MLKRAFQVVLRRNQPPVTETQRRESIRTRRPSAVLLYAAVAALLFFGSSAVEAVSTAYCQEAYIDGCLNTMHCTFWDGGVYAGSIHVNYHCPV